VNELTVYFRSAGLVITERLIRVRIPGGWQVWVIADLHDFRAYRLSSAADRRSWALGGPALVLVLLSSRLGGWLLLTAVLLFAAACAWYAADCRAARRRACSRLCAVRRGVWVLLFQLPNQEFDAACRGLRRVLERLADGHS
jgi:hypothetical protein